MVSEKDVTYIANLSRIHLAEDETKNLAKDLEQILGYITKLEKLDITGIEPTSHALPLKNVHREDEIKPSLSQDNALSFSIEKHEGSFKVPKVIE